jgi:hypothetical protein
MRLGWHSLVLLAFLAAGSFRCDNTTCIERKPDVGSACIPDPVQPDQRFTIQVREACGLCSTPPTCDATLLSGQLRVDVHSQFCNDGSITCDTNLCLQRTVVCLLPSLPVGDWPLLLPGDQVRVIRVRDGGLSSCQLP